MGKFSNLIFYYQPNENIKLYIISTAIEKYTSIYLNKYDYEINNNNTYNIILIASFRKCLVGEYFRSEIKKLTFN